jgi:hypothetical protein
VEALVAALFVSLAAVEVLGRGMNLPGLANDAALASSKTHFMHVPVRHAIADTPELLWGMYAFQLLLLCTLLCAALIEHDGQAAPLRLFVPALVVGFATPILWPDLRPVPMWPESVGPSWLRGLASGATGILAGAVAGGAALAASARAKETGTLARAIAFVAPFGLCGLFLGRQAGAALAALAALVLVASAAASRAVPALSRSDWSASLAVAAILLLFAWGPSAALVPWMSPRAGPAVLATSLVAVTLASLMTARFLPPVPQLPVHQLPVHQPPADQPPADQLPADQLPADQLLADSSSAPGDSP